MARFFTMLRGFCEKDYETGASYAPPFESNRTDRYVGTALAFTFCTTNASRWADQARIRVRP